FDYSGGLQHHASPRSACPTTQPIQPRSAKSPSEKSSVGRCAPSSQKGGPNWLVAVGSSPRPVATILTVLVGASTALAPRISAGTTGTTAKAPPLGHASQSAPITTGSASIRTPKNTARAGVVGFAVVPQALEQP